MPNLSLAFLGTPQIHLNGVEVDLRSQKSLALLAYLAVTNEPHSREALAAWFWPESNHTRARAALRSCLWTLKKNLGESWFSIKRESLAFNCSDAVAVDVTTFQQLLTQSRALHLTDDPARLQYLQQAVALYQDDFLSGFTLPDCPLFNEWCYFKSEALRQAMFSTLNELSAAYKELGEYESAIRYTRQRLALDPLSEEVHYQLIELYARSSQQAAALRQYEACVAMLKEEFGAQPQETTQALKRRIQNPTPPAASPQQHNLPRLTTPLIGRQHELATIAERLSDPACQLLTLTGMGGIGKTHLALHYAREQIPHYPEGIALVSLVSLSEARRFAPSLANALHFMPQGGRDLWAQLLDYLREKQILLVIDNCETLPQSADFICEILKHAPKVKVLATSRKRLLLQSEWILELRGLSLPSDNAAAGSPDGDALKLFVQEATRVQPDYSIVNSDQHAKQICIMLQGIPLALKLAAPWVRSLSCEEIAAEIAKDLDFLNARVRDLPDRHQNLRAVFEQSWNLLSEEERQVCSCLTVFHGGFTRDAAHKVAQASLLVLANLIDKSFVHKLGKRYDMIAVLRQYSQKKLNNESMAATQALHSAYFLSLLEGFTPDLNLGREKNAVQSIRREIENVHQAWQWAVDTAQINALEQWLDPIFWYYYMSNQFQTGDVILTQAIEKLADLEITPAAQLLHAKLLSRRGVLKILLGRYDEVIADQQTSLETFRTQENHAEVAFSLLSMSFVTIRHGEFDSAQAILEEALELTRNLHLPRLQADTLRMLSSTWYYRGDYHKTHSYGEEALQIYQEIRSPRGECAAHHNLGIALGALGDYPKAKKHLKQALQLAQQQGYIHLKRLILDALADLASCQGDHMQALDLYQQSLHIYSTYGNRGSQCTCRSNLGEVWVQLGEFAQAREHYQKAQQLAQVIGERRVDVRIFRGLARLELYQNDLAAAAQHIEQALVTAEELQDKRGEKRARVIQGQILSAQQQPQEARAAYQNVIAQYTDTQDPILINAQAGLARLNLTQGKPLEALGYVENILQYLEQHSSEGEVAPFTVHLTCIEVLEANQDPRMLKLQQQTVQQLQALADKIPDTAMRQKFLHNIPAHKTLLERTDSNKAATQMRT